MAEARYTPIEGNVRLLGDSCDIDGTLNVDGVATFTGGQATLKLSSAPTGTLAGIVWTSGAPAFTAGQKWILATAGSTTWRIPVFDNA
jgi:hypothetical protein